MKLKVISILLAAAMALSLAACSGPQLTEITLPESPLELATGETAALELGLLYDGETPENAKPDVTYTSSDEAVATVAEDGTVTAVAEGEATITATTGDLSATQTVVVSIPVESLTVEDIALHMDDGETALVYTVTPEDFSGELTFAVADEAIAAVSADGKITPVAEGETTVTVTAPNGVNATAAVDVWSGPRELALTAGRTEVTKGSGTQISVTDEQGNTVDGETLLWSSSDENVAAVTSGWVDVVGTGSVTITASNEHGVSASIDLTGVAPAAPAKAGGASGAASAAGGGDGNVSLSSGALPFSMAAGTQEWFGVDYGDNICNAVVNNINQYRAAVGAAPLTCTADMSAIADSRCLTMVVNGVMSHDGNQTAEIIAQNYNSAASVVEGWANSSGHYAAMTNPNYTVCGVGCAFEESGWSYWCVTLA